MFEINCPSCGSPVQFRRESSVYSICESCRSVLVRNDVNVELIGKASDLHPDCSPLQLGTSGMYDGKPFEIIGRLQICHDTGYWNEWYISFTNGDTGWISDSLGEYFVSAVVDTKGIKIPPAESLMVGSKVSLGKRVFTVSNKGQSQVASYEGELPFVMGGSYPLPYVDLRSTSEMAGTLDYSESPPLVFLGYYKDFDEFKFQGLRSLEDIEVESHSGKTVSTLKCPTCGAPHELSAGPRSQSLVCEYCDTCIDTTTPALNVLWRAKQNSSKVKPLIPLHTKGKIAGVEWECLGFQRKYSTYDGVKYFWSEYVFYNHHYGYRYLVESEGHWSWTNTIHSVPESSAGFATRSTTDAVKHGGNTYKHFASYYSHVDYVIGEFPYRVNLKSESYIGDFINPPYGLSSETDTEGTYWSKATYMEPEEVVAAFGITETMPARTGVGSMQPSPYGELLTYSFMWTMIIVIAGFFLMVVMGGASKEALNQTFSLVRNQEPCKITREFTIPSGTRSVSVNVNANLDNRWIFYDMALCNVDTGETFAFTAQTDLYHGYDSIDNEYWSEGSPKTESIVPGVTPGKYILRIDPETGTGDNPETFGPNEKKSDTVLHITASVSTNPPFWTLFIIISVLVSLPVVAIALIHSSKESERWSTSDHAPSTDDDDDDDYDFDDD